MSEPGGWHPNDKEIAGFRAYFLKGGFMIFDDFREGWNGQLRLDEPAPSRWRARCRARSGFSSPATSRSSTRSSRSICKAAVSGTSAYGNNLPTYWGIYQDNDPKKRLILIANVDNDIGESWQWSASGFVPITAANETYKLGINYIIYALTH